MRLPFNYHWRNHGGRETLTHEGRQRLEVQNQQRQLPCKRLLKANSYVETTFAVVMFRNSPVVSLYPKLRSAVLHQQKKKWVLLFNTP